MNLKILACATLLFASCGNSKSPKEEVNVPVTRTEVKHGTEIILVKPEPKGGMSINEALMNRQSSREYTGETLSLEELSGMMWAAAGINRPENGFRTAPSALALYPINAYAIFAEGIYHYDAKAHKLVRVAEGDHRQLAGFQDFVYTAPLNIVYIADLSVYEGKNFPAETVRYICGQDAAGYAENANLYAVGHGLKSITRGGVKESELFEVIGLDTNRYFLALAQTAGK